VYPDEAFHASEINNEGYIKMRVVITTVLLSVFLVSGCSSRSNEEVVERSGIDVMYETAQTYLDVGRFADAAQTLQAINTRFPFGPYSTQVQLDLIYANYKVGDQDRALAAIDRFLQLNPNHADLDYVRFMRGLVYQQAESSFLQDSFGIDRSDRSNYYAKRAFEEFRELVRLFPESQYAADAHERMVGLSSRLAKHELAVAEYYLRREAYLAAANRAKGVVESHPGVPEQERALEIMVESYRSLGLEQQASDARTVLRSNFR